MNPVVMGAIGMVAGLTAFLLGIAQLACEHPRAPASMRVCIFFVALLGAWTCFDSWDAFAGLIHRTDYKSVAFCAVLSLYWGYRRAFNMRTDYQMRTRFR